MKPFRFSLRDWLRVEVRDWSASETWSALALFAILAALAYLMIVTL